ncbi:hypothetical protein PHYBLDRAFT_102335, partial [Phycomyces blakesleeanus NRRL 1555(-)]
TKLVMEQARQDGSSGIGLLLDQEKAYDRVRPEYLRQVLQHFDFHPSLVTRISQLFFSTQIQINVNGHLS